MYLQVAQSAGEVQNVGQVCVELWSTGGGQVQLLPHRVQLERPQTVDLTPRQQLLTWRHRQVERPSVSPQTGRETGGETDS